MIEPDKSQGQRSNITAFLADQSVGREVVLYMLQEHPSHTRCVITTDENEIAEIARSYGCETHIIGEINERNVATIFEGVEVIFLAWWPRIIPGYIINAPKTGVVNFHPSLLPYNRGKNYNFWTIVENTPFGVTLHFADEGIDSGDIIFQSPIEKGWEDTGETLYLKAQKEMVALFKARYLDIIEGNYARIPQDAECGQIHYFRELDPASRIHLDKTYNAADLLNLLRARTFTGKPSCYFYDNGRKYEVRISIKEAADEPN
ncbi:MAG: formyltransferase family protein [Gammaproteobacteria bacterium]|jgi:methionyl-tRNA formyltransferase